MNRFKALALGLALFSSSFAAVTVTTEQSDCLGQTGGEDKITVEASGCTLVLKHLNIALNCCLKYKVEAEIEQSTIHLTELDVGPPCDCICTFNLEARVEGLQSGVYKVQVKALRHPEPLHFQVQIPPCETFLISGGQVWSYPGIMGVSVPVLATNDKELEGFSFGTTYSSEKVRVAEITLRDTVTESLEPEYTDFRINNKDPTGKGWATCAVVLDSEPPFQGKKIPAGKEQVIARLVFDILPLYQNPPKSISVPIVGGVGDPPLDLAFLVKGQRIEPKALYGIIQIMFPPPSFVRGDINGDGEVNISDPIYLLAFLFAGGPKPTCEDAADVNDDGRVDLSDAIKCLGYLFSGDRIPPPSPPGPADWDPTLDPLGCEKG